MKALNPFPDNKSLLNNARFKGAAEYTASATKICEVTGMTPWAAPHGVTNPQLDSKTGALTTVVERKASEGTIRDGGDNTFKIHDKWMLYVGGFTCTSGCQKVTAGFASGFFDMPVTQGAYTLATGAALAFGAASLF